MNSEPAMNTEAMNHLTPAKSNGKAEQVKQSPELPHRELDKNDSESHMMRGALRALFTVGVIMVIFRMSRRALRRAK